MVPLDYLRDDILRCNMTEVLRQFGQVNLIWGRTCELLKQNILSLKLIFENSHVSIVMNNISYIQ